MNRHRSSWSAEAGLVGRLIVRVTVSPVLSVGLIGILICMISLLTSGGVALVGGLLLAPVVLGLALLTRPTVGAFLVRYRLPEEVRRNHALEHGTIHYLRKHYGTRYKLSGRSEARGFRVAGARTPADI